MLCFQVMVVYNDTFKQEVMIWFIAAIYYNLFTT